MIKVTSDASLETRLPSLEGEDKIAFLNFVRRMIRWLPEERATAGELLEDPWLNKLT